MPLYGAKHYPDHFAELKKSIIGDEAKVTQSWADLLAALKAATAEYAKKGPSMIPIVEFDQLETLGMFTFPRDPHERFCATLRSSRRKPSCRPVLVSVSTVPHSDEQQ
jgi:hypothetical protein